MGWFLPWLLIAGVVGVAVWMVVDYVGRPTVGSVAENSDGPAPTTVRSVTPESPSPEPATPTPTEEPRERKPKKLITAGVTVQVLNGTDDPEAADAMAARLEQLGFTIAAVESTSQPYEETTVFWSFPDAKKAALALGQKFDWPTDPKPENLADTVSLHVVVGRDEA